MLKKSFEDRVGEKKIDKVLEEGKPKEGKSWVDKVRPENNEMNFDGQEQLGDQSKAIDLMKEESTQFMMPEQGSTNEMVLTDDQQEKAIELMGDNNSLEDSQNELKLINGNNDYKIDAYKAITKSNEEIEAIKEENFFDEVYRDEVAVEAREADMDFGEGNEGMDGGDGPDFD